MHGNLTPTRRTLLSRLKEWDDRESWEEFFHTYWKLIYHVALRAGLPESEAQDVVQETIISVARQIPNFKYDRSLGSFRSWLYLITRRRVTDHLRKQYRQVKANDQGPHNTSRTATIERVPDPAPPNLETIWDHEWNEHVMSTALHRVKDRADPKQFQLFDCYVRKEWAVKEICTAFGVTPNQVYLAKHRISQLLENELQQLRLP